MDDIPHSLPPVAAIECADQRERSHHGHPLHLELDPRDWACRVVPMLSPVTGTTWDRMGNVQGGVIRFDGLFRIAELG